MSIYFVVTIIVLLSALACYALITQAIEKKRIHKQRLLMALKTKHRNFVFMINGLPPNFLGSDLLGLVYRALIDTCEQLSALEPHDNRHNEELKLYTNQLAALSKSGSPQRARLENPQQMKEIRQHLQELQRFVIHQATLKLIKKVQFESYIDQIKRLNLQMSVDVYMFYAKQAQQNSKLRLAIHYFTLARKLLTTENATRLYDKQIAHFDDIIGKLEEKAHIQGEPLAGDDGQTSADEAVTKEWDSFDKKTKDEKEWKKKQVYD